MSQGAADPPRPEEPFNPYAAPAAELDWRVLFDPASHDLASEVLYSFHRRREQTIRLLAGIVLVVFVPLGVLGTILAAAALVDGLERDPEAGFRIQNSWRGSLASGVLCMMFGFVGSATCWGLRRLAPWARTIAAILLTGGLVVGLLVGWSAVWGIGLVVGGWIWVLVLTPILAGLHLLLSPSASVVFSPAYRKIAERKRAEASASIPPAS